MADIIDGKKISQEIKDELKERVAELKAQGKTGALAVIQVGNDAASGVYVRNKKKACAYIGIESLSYELPEETSQQELLSLIEKLNQDETVRGILVQLPVPEHIDENTIIRAICPSKDVDGFHPQSVGAMTIGQKCFLPCTPAGIIQLLKRSNIEIEGKNCVVIGRSNIVGKPMALLMLRENATVTITHSKTRNLKEICKNADILIAAIGKPQFITAEYVKKGAVVIDVGIHRDEANKLCGDVKFDEVEPLASAITPVPGGVGPMTIAMLMTNCVESIAEIEEKKMKCAKCGAELKLGCIYCSVCGQEAQIVSDSSLIEEELLRELLKEEEEAKAKPVSETKKRKKKKSHKALIISISSVAALGLAAVLLVISIQKKNDNSYEYQVQKAEAYIEEKNYIKALGYYDRALELKEDDVTVRFDMVKLYLAMEEEKSAISLLHEILSLDAENRNAYEQLIGLYEKNSDYDAILKLKEEAPVELQKLFADYEAKMPEFSIEPGTYADYITVELQAEAGSRIYYTLDHSDPVEHGLLYQEPFTLEEQGTLEIRAVSCNEYGIYSDVADGRFVVEFSKPQMARAVPNRGTFMEPMVIELTGPEGCHIYYTWDGSEPTVNSAEYTGPIPIPEGNNILSVILVDKYGMFSDVLKCNYSYLP